MLSATTSFACPSEVVQVYPPMQDEPLTPLQAKLLKKLGQHACPFVLQVGLWAVREGGRQLKFISRDLVFTPFSAAATACTVLRAG